MSETKIKNPFYSKAHIQLSNGRNINIFEYRDLLIRPYLYRLYDDHINWKEHPGVEILGEDSQDYPAPREFMLLKFQDELHLLRAALICPELASLNIKKEVWIESAVYYRRRMVNSAIESKRRYEYNLKELEEFTKDPEGFINDEQSAVLESTKLKDMLASLRSPVYNRKRLSAGYPRHRMKAPASGTKPTTITP